MRHILLAIVVALLTSCGGARQPAATPLKAQANQSAVEASSGMAAAERMLGASMTPELADVLNGSAAFARATIGEDQVPAATWPMDRIVAFPHAFLNAGMSAERHANGTWNRWALGVAAMAVAPFLLYAAKFVPVVGPYVETIGGAAWKVLASRATKDQEEARDTIYGHAGALYTSAIQAMPPEAVVGFLNKIPQPVKDALSVIPSVPPTTPAVGS